MTAESLEEVLKRYRGLVKSRDDRQRDREKALAALREGREALVEQITQCDDDLWQIQEILRDYEGLARGALHMEATRILDEAIRAGNPPGAPAPA